MPVTASSMIFTALRKIGEKAIGGTLSTNEKTDYLADLNSMMDSWSIERLMVYQSLQESSTVSAASTTIGSGAAWNTTRPTKITGAFIRDSSNVDHPLTIIPIASYNSIATKTVTSPYPRYLAYDAAYDANGYAKIWLYEAPVSSGVSLFIDSWKQLQSFSTISHGIALPPGYQLAIESNLAIWLAAGYREVPKEVVRVARDSKAAIKGVNLPDAIMHLDAGMVGRRTRANIEAGI